MKKRLFSILLCCALLIGILPVGGSAEELFVDDDSAYSVQGQESGILASETYINPYYEDVVSESDLVQPDGGTVIRQAGQAYYDTEQAAAEWVRAQLCERTEAVMVGWKVPATDDISTVQVPFKPIMEAAMQHTGVPVEGDYLKWQYAGWKGTATYHTEGDYYCITLTYTMTYYTTAQEEAEVDARIDQLMTEELNPAGRSEYQQICAIYNYVCSTVTYDYANLNDSDYKKKYTAYAALFDKTAVCQGYALLVYRLALESGIDCRFISGLGNGGAHGWNIVRLDDVYYNVDSTWDASREQGEYRYFLKSEQSFTGHVRDSDYATEDFYAAYPMSETDSICDHQYEQIAFVEATCTQPGEQRLVCSLCGKEKTEKIAQTEHTETTIPAVAATCTAAGKTEGSKCAVCGTILKQQETVPAAGHSYTTTVTKATPSANGSTRKVCTRCGVVSSTTIYKASKITLSQTSYSYSGAVKKPSVTVKDSKGNTIASKYYTVKYPSGMKQAGSYQVTVTFRGDRYQGSKKLSYTIKPASLSGCTATLSKTSYTYSGKTKHPSVTVKKGGTTLKKGTDYTVTDSTRTKVGKATVKITGKGNYTGTVKKTFKINPKKASGVSLKAGCRSFTAKWKKQTVQTTGYQICYATNKAFTAGKKTVTVKKNTTVSRTVSGLKAGKKYYVRIRTYRTVDGEPYYSAWSNVKTVKTKR